MLRKFILSSIFLFIVVMTGQAFACGTCGCTLHNLGKDRAGIKSEGRDGWYFEYLFDQTNWDRMDAREAHNIHHDGHEVHDRTTEDFHHFKFGAHATEDLDVFVDLPYVIRRYLEVDTHAILGSKQRSEGWGDVQLIGNYRFWHQEAQSLSAVAGFQFPTGYTKEKNSIGSVAEAELQPGSGAYD